MDEEKVEHYYGDEVRGLFIIGGLIMVISYPFFSSIIGVPLIFSIFGCVVLAVFAGLMNPKQKWVVLFNTIISILAFIVFEYSAVRTYLILPSTERMNIVFFWANQVLSIIFFSAAYLSTKTYRGIVSREK